MTYGDFAIAFHYTDLNVLCAGLYDFEKRLDRELDGVLAGEVILVVLLKELSYCLR